MFNKYSRSTKISSIFVLGLQATDERKRLIICNAIVLNTFLCLMIMNRTRTRRGIHNTIFRSIKSSTIKHCLAEAADISIDYQQLHLLKDDYGQKSNASKTCSLKSKDGNRCETAENQLPSKWCCMLTKSHRTTLRQPRLSAS